MSEAWRQTGTPRAGGILLIGDHASAHVPDDIDLGINPALLREHIAIDLGVSEVAALLVDAGAVDAAILGGVSRLVVDCNREEEAPGAVPIASDGHAIPGNALDHEAPAIAALEEEGLTVGDQLPYSGKLLNATMNRHAEANDIPYVGIEMRQDLVGDAAGQALFAERLARMCKKVSLKL